jgi:hypothetical protein
MLLSEIPYEPRELKEGEISTSVRYTDGNPNINLDLLLEAGITNPVVIEKGNAPQVTIYAIIANKEKYHFEETVINNRLSQFKMTTL